MKASLIARNLSLGLLVASIAACGGGGSDSSPPPPGIVNVAPTSLSWSAVDNGANPDSKVFRITNTGGSSFSWTASSDAAWATPTPASGTCTVGQQVTVTVAIDSSTLTAGNYTGTITVAAPGATGTPKTVALALTVTPSTPLISLSSGTLNFTATEGGANPASQIVTISNTGTGTLDFIATPNARWITATPATGTAPASLTVGINITGLGQGVYYGFVTIWSDSADNSPVKLIVTLTVNPAAAPPAGAKWTIMVYMNADNDLETFGIQDINEMEAAGVPADVNVLVFVDRHAGYDSTNGNWTDGRVYLIQSDANPTTITSPYALWGSEPNMGDPANVVAFCNYAITNYPANKYALVIWNHGGGWQTTGQDLTNADDLELLELANAMAAVNGGGFVFDLLLFDECLMGQLEVASELAPFAKVLTGSEEVTGGYGMDYAAALSYLATESNASPQALGARFSYTFSAFYQQPAFADEKFTNSTIDLAQIAAVVAATDTLAATLQADILVEYVNITRALGLLEEFQGAADFIDLADFCEVLRQVSANATVQADCAAVIAAVRAAMLYADSGEARPHPIVRGLTLYFPEDNLAATIAAYQAGCTFATSPSPWVDMVNAYHNTAGLDTTDPTVTNLVLSANSVSSSGSIDVTVDVQDDIVLDSATIFAAIESGTNWIFVEFSHVCPPAVLTLADGRDVDLWGAGPYTVNFSWQPTGWAVSDGYSSYLTVPQFPCQGEDSAEAITIDARYRRNGAAGFSDAVLQYDAQTGALQAAYAVSGESVAEVTLGPGDQVEIVVTVLDTTTGNVANGTTGTFTIVAGRDLFLTPVALPSGSYRLGLLAEDMNENVGAASLPITVTP